MLQFIRDFLSRRRRMREFVAAGRKHHAMKPFQPDWVDTLAMPPRDDPAGNVKADPGYAKPPAPPAPPSEVRREGFLSRRITPPPMPPVRAAAPRRDWVPPGPIAPAPSPNTLDLGTTMLVLNLDSGRAPAADEPWPRNKFEPGGGGDFGGAGASGDWAPRECRRESDMPTFDRNDAGDSDSGSSSSSSSSSD